MMAANYPFSVDGNEFQGKRVLVTGGTKGMRFRMSRSRLPSIGTSAVKTMALQPRIRHVSLTMR